VTTPFRSTGKRRWLLGAVLGSVAINAVLGVIALLADGLGETGDRVLGTSACVTAAGMLTLGCFPALERHRLGLVPKAGIALSLAGFVIAVVGIWGSIGSLLERVMGTTLTLGVGCVLGSLFVLVRIAPRYRIVLPISLILVAVLDGLVVAAVWDAASGTAIGVASVLVAAASIALPVLHVASRDEIAPSVIHPARYCPACGAGVAPREASEPIRCGGCGASFRVSFLEGPEPHQQG